MKFLYLTLLVFVALSRLPAQERRVPEYESALKQHVEEVATGVGNKYNQAVASLKSSYAGALQRAQKGAQDSGKLEEALALKNEATALMGKEALPPLKATSPDSLKKLRSVFDQSAAKLEKDRQAALAPLNKQFQTTLDSLVASLTKIGRLEDAMFVKNKRAALANTLAVAPPAIGDDKIFTNTLGMKFIPLPGTKVLMCIHETRRADYAAYAAENAAVNGTWQFQNKNNTPIGMGDNHPVVGVSWSDARAFCSWLSKKEGRTYRLPTDREWSYAVGLGHSEKKNISPDALSGKIKDEYPWGSKWPPPKGAGNFADKEMKAKLGSELIVEGYSDGFPTTAPVMSFPVNKLGFYDLAGNVWEWCEEWYSASKVDRVSRGGSWSTRTAGALLSSNRDHTPPDRRDPSWGFRCVLENDE